MSGYTPVFRSVFEGTLCGQYPDTAAWLFLLALADKHGHVDKTPQYISAVTGMPVAELLGCIDRFMQPDPMSRTPTDDGRRLAMIDPARPWGWRIVNFHVYRERARLMSQTAEQVADGRNAEKVRRYRERMKEAASNGDTRRHPPTPADTLSDADSDSDTDKNPERRGASKPRPARKCPHDFEITADLRAWATEKAPGVDVERATEAFRDHTFTRAITDWPGAWRNWMRREKPLNGHRAVRPVRLPKTVAQLEAEAIARGEDPYA